MRRHISQREAHRLEKMVHSLASQIENNKRAWSSDYVGGVNLGRLDLCNNIFLAGQIHAARKLRHAVVVTTDISNSNIINFWAVK